MKLLFGRTIWCTTLRTRGRGRDLTRFLGLLLGVGIGRLLCKLLLTLLGLSRFLGSGTCTPNV